jgi:hypothetical protein
MIVSQQTAPHEAYDNQHPASQAAACRPVMEQSARYAAEADFKAPAFSISM